MNDILFHMVPGAPSPVAPFSHATEANGFVFVTGQMPSLPDWSYPANVAAQTHQTMRNLQTVLEGLGLSLADVLMTRIYLTHFYEDYDAVNAAYASYFPEDRRPARTCVGVTGLAKGARVEIDFVARRP